MGQRTNVFFNEVPYSIDILQSQVNYYAALGKFCGAVLGYGTFINNMNCIPDSPADLSVQITPGELYSVQPIDTTYYGTTDYGLPPNSNTIVKQCINYTNVSLAITPPSTVGFSQIYLVQMAFSEVDAVPVLRAFYSTSSATVNTQRQDLPIISLKAGVAATTGTEVAPAPDAGFTGAWLITVAHGQTTITSGDIAQDSGAPFIGGDYGVTLPLMLTQASAASLYLSQVNALLQFAQRPDVGNGENFVVGAGSNTTVSGATALPFARTAGQTWVASSQFTAPWQGAFNGTFAVSSLITSVGSGEVIVSLELNGSTVLNSITLAYPDTSLTNKYGSLPFTLFLNAGDHITVVATNNGAGSYDAQVTYFSITAAAN